MADSRRVYRGRLAPSPSGRLHFGHVRTFLVAWLRARREPEGRVILRLEDLDAPRMVTGSAASILRDLRWLGLDWDEGPESGGPFGPYVQSERFARYEDAIATLIEKGVAYRCTCTRKEIGALASAPHGLEELGAPYPGTCREGARVAARPAALRFVMPRPAPKFVDGLYGETEVPEAAFDFVVRRADGVYSYQLAVVVDDHAMGVTEVVRGADLLSSTPRQIALHQALGYEPPAFLHVPLVVSPDGERVAKRRGDLSIEELRAQGHSAEKIVGRAAASLGLSPDGAPVKPSELVASFELSAIRRKPFVLAGFA